MTDHNEMNGASDQEGRSERDAKPTEQNKDRAAQDALDRGDKEKIDKTLDELKVSTTDSGKDQSRKSDTEGSNSSSKNLDEQSD